MNGTPRRIHWAVGLAAWVGGAAGSIVAPSMDSLGLSTEGSSPLLGGAAAIYVAFVLGGVAGAAGGALVAYGAGRGGHERRAAVAGAGAGILVAALAGYVSENVAQWWATAFFQAPLTAGLYGGILAGLVAGVASATILRAMRSEGPARGHERRFAALVGSLMGLWSGFGGAILGVYLAMAQCPAFAAGGTTYGGPAVLAGCGFEQGAVAFGAWAGGAAGAASALLAATILPLLSRSVGPGNG